MGIIKAAAQAITGGFADQWLEVIEPDNMGAQTVFTRGIKTKKGQNKRGTDDTVSNGSMIHVYENQFMMLVDGGKIVDYTAEPGYYKVSNSSLPSLFNGELGEAIQEAYERIKFGGQTSKKQKVYYINLQEIKGIRFGTRNPINYFDNFYNAELFLRAHGTYSIRITNPLQFYAEAIPRNKDYVEIAEINDQYISEFLEALQASINQMSADGTRISFVTSKARELGKYMASVLDEEWGRLRGMEIQSVGIANISYDENSQKLINMRNEGAMLSDPTIREGYMQGHFARGMEKAGSNGNGAIAGFMGMNMASGMMGQASQTNLAQMQAQQSMQYAQQQNKPQPSSNTWTCECGNNNTGKFCSECGKPAPIKEWKCACGTVNTGKFCMECGKPAPAKEWKCTCGALNTGNFCSECGKKR